MRSMKNNKIYTVGLIFCSLCVFAQGQMVSKGVLSVKPNTLLSVVSDFRNTHSGVYKNDGEVLFRGHFTNNGTFSHSAISNGFTRFEGTSNQKLSGSNPAVFNDVLLYNQTAQPAFHLEGDVVVTREIEFNQGVVDNENFGGIITFDQNANHINTWDGSHVDGFVNRLGNHQFTFPIGNEGFYRRSSINGMSGDNSQFASKFIFENSNSNFPHQQKQIEIDWIDNQEYWIIENLGTTQDVIITLTWDEVTTTPHPLIANTNHEIQIVRWDKVQNKWVSEGGVADKVNRTVTTTSSVSGSEIFTLGLVQKDQKDCVEVFNSVSANGDDKNSYLHIGCLENYPNNTIEIFNRWGVKVFATQNYNTTGNVFRGFSDGRTTISGNDKLPTGTYFYILTYQDNSQTNSKNHKKAGFLHLNSD